jgi:hypothetical protein
MGNPPGGKILRNYDSDSSIFADLRGGNHLNENSFTEQMLDKNKIVYSQPGAQGLANNGGGKRVGSNERIHRPRSSKGNRGLVSAGNANFFTNQ